jgi:hypothetical protein
VDSRNRGADDIIAFRARRLFIGKFESGGSGKGTTAEERPVTADIQRREKIQRRP